MHFFRIAIRTTSVNKTASICRFHTTALRMTNGDLNNTAAERTRIRLEVDPSYRNQSFAIPQSQDDAEIREKYRPFILDEEISKSDWVSQLELSTALKMVENQIIGSGQDRLRVLVLHGSMRNRYVSVQGLQRSSEVFTDNAQIILAPLII